MDGRKTRTDWSKTTGPSNYNWAGDSVSINGGRKRAWRRYKIGPCESCGEVGLDRHHKDGNTANNEPDNIAILCRRCHMVADGRLAKLPHNGRPPRAQRICLTCGADYWPLRKGLCSRCESKKRYYERKARNGNS